MTVASMFALRRSNRLDMLPPCTSTRGPVNCIGIAQIRPSERSGERVMLLGVRGAACRAVARRANVSPSD